MSNLVIYGNNKIFGEITAESAKNAMLPLISACIMYEGKVTFNRCPKLKDVLVMLEIIEYLGGKYSFNGEELTVDCSSLYLYELPFELTKKIRASIFMVGAILGRFHKACFCSPGGCNIGERPIDIHLDGLRQLGVEISSGDCIFCKTDKLKGNEIILKYKSVGATENLIMAGVLAEGKTIINNAAKEPEIICLVKLLKLFGAKIYGAGTSRIVVEGVSNLNKQNVYFSPISDRIEIGTYILLTMSVGGEILIKNVNANHNLALLKKIYNNACKIVVDNDKIYIKSSGAGKSLGYVKTAPYPLFPTDLQAQLIAYSSTLNGTTVVEETVFNSRFSHCFELNKMGADIIVKNNKAIIKGVNGLTGASVVANDLRGGASLVIAGLKAEGKTVIGNAEAIDRGYFQIEKKLQLVGANIKRE